MVTMHSEHSDYLNAAYHRIENEMNKASDDLSKQYQIKRSKEFFGWIGCGIGVLLSIPIIALFNVIFDEIIAIWLLLSPIICTIIARKLYDINKKAVSERLCKKLTAVRQDYIKKCDDEKERIGNDFKTRREAIIKNMSKLQGCVDWFMRCFDDGLAKADRAEYQKYVEVVMSFTVFQNSISVTTGNSSYNFDFFKNSLNPLKSQEDTIAFAQAMDQVLRSRIIEKYPKDPADSTNYNKPVASIQRTAWNDNRMTLVYHAPNPKYKPPINIV